MGSEVSFTITGTLPATLMKAPRSLFHLELITICLLYTSDAADDLLCVDFGGRRIIRKKLILDDSQYAQ